jgi:hypothetical protein
MSTPTINQQDVARLVSEVISRIRSQSSPGPSLPARAATSPPLALTDRVINAETIERLPAGTDRVTLPHRAVVTPSAHDAARQRGLVLVPGPRQPTGSAGRPLMIARADCRSDVTGLTAAISRAVPTSQQLPAAGLTTVLASLADHAGRDAARGLLITDQPAIACVAANRHRSLRAVTGNDPATLDAAATACAANLLIVEPGRIPTRSLERLAAALTTRETTPPAPLTDTVASPSSTSCSCQQGSHHH